MYRFTFPVMRLHRVKKAQEVFSQRDYGERHTESEINSPTRITLRIVRKIGLFRTALFQMTREINYCVIATDVEYYVECVTCINYLIEFINSEQIAGQWTSARRISRIDNIKYS